MNPLFLITINKRNNIATVCINLFPINYYFPRDKAGMITEESIPHDFTSIVDNTNIATLITVDDLT